MIRINLERLKQMNSYPLFKNDHEYIQMNSVSTGIIKAEMKPYLFSIISFCSFIFAIHMDFFCVFVFISECELNVSNIII